MLLWMWHAKTSKNFYTVGHRHLNPSSILMVVSLCLIIQFLKANFNSYWKLWYLFNFICLIFKISRFLKGQCFAFSAWELFFDPMHLTSHVIISIDTLGIFQLSNYVLCYLDFELATNNNCWIKYNKWPFKQI